jgi:hypothetical protein
MVRDVADVSIPQIRRWGCKLGISNNRRKWKSNLSKAAKLCPLVDIKSQDDITIKKRDLTLRLR